MERNLISVIIPVFNSACFIEDTINSIINQNFRKIEIICVDDCSTDETVNKIQFIQKTDQRIHLLQLRPVLRLIF